VNNLKLTGHVLDVGIKNMTSSGLSGHKRNKKQLSALQLLVILRLLRKRNNQTKENRYKIKD